MAKKSWEEFLAIVGKEYPNVAAYLQTANEDGARRGRTFKKKYEELFKDRMPANITFLVTWANNPVFRTEVWQKAHYATQNLLC